MTSIINYFIKILTNIIFVINRTIKLNIRYKNRVRLLET